MNNHAYFDDDGNKIFPFLPQVQAAAQKLLDNYYSKLKPDEQNDVNVIMEHGSKTGEIDYTQAQRLGWLTYAYPNNFVYIVLGWWNGADND